MAFAYFTVHLPQGFFPINNHGEAAVMYCFVFFLLIFTGGGVYALDARRGRLAKKSPAAAALTRVLADRREERADVVDKQLRLLECRKVPTARHRRPVCDVVGGLTPASRSTQDFLGRSGDASRKFDTAIGDEAVEALPVQPR